jgi:GMP synthase-like glutamine amidotransferase
MSASDTDVVSTDMPFGRYCDVATTVVAVRGLAIGNGNDFDTGFVGERLREHGYTLVECHREDPDQWPALDAIDLVLTLGSEWHVYERQTAELVAAEGALVRDVVRRGMPLVAICFGAQVLADALGATASRAPAPEIGWIDIELPDGDGSSVPAGPWLVWHEDVFTVPDGFAELARSPAGPQLVRGERTIATQFHPEATEAMVARWLTMGGDEQLRGYGLDPDEFLARTRRNVEFSGPNAAALVDWFLAKVAG